MLQDWLDCSDQLPLVVTKGIIQGDEDALFISVCLVSLANNWPVLSKAFLRRPSRRSLHRNVLWPLFL